MTKRSRVIVASLIFLLISAFVSILLNNTTGTASAYSTDKHTTIYPQSYFPMKNIDHIASSDEYMTYISTKKNIEVLVEQQNKITYISKSFKKEDIEYNESTEELKFFVIKNNLITLVSDKTEKTPKRFYLLSLTGSSNIPEKKDITFSGMVFSDKNIISTNSHLIVKDHDKTIYKYDSSLNLIGQKRFSNLTADETFAFIEENQVFGLLRHKIKRLVLNDFTDPSNPKSENFNNHEVGEYNFYKNLNINGHLLMSNDDATSFASFNTLSNDPKNEKLKYLTLDNKPFKSDTKIEHSQITIFNNQLKILKDNEVKSYTFDANNGNLTLRQTLSHESKNENDIKSFNKIVKSENNFYIADGKSGKIYKATNEFTEKETLVSNVTNVTHMTYHNSTLWYSTENALSYWDYTSRTTKTLFKLTDTTERIISFTFNDDYSFVLTNKGLYKYDLVENEKTLIKDTEDGKYKLMAHMNNGTKLFLLRTGYVDVYNIETNEFIKEISTGSNIDISKQVSIKTDKKGNIYLLSTEGIVTLLKDISYSEFTITKHDVLGKFVGDKISFTDFELVSQAKNENKIYLATTNYLAEYNVDNDIPDKLELNKSSIPKSVTYDNVMAARKMENAKFWKAKSDITNSVYFYNLKDTNDSIFKYNTKDEKNFIMTFDYDIDGFTYCLFNGKIYKIKSSVLQNNFDEIQLKHERIRMQIKKNTTGYMFPNKNSRSTSLYSGAEVDKIFECDNVFGDKDYRPFLIKYKNEYYFVNGNDLAKLITYTEKQANQGTGIIQSNQIGKKVKLYSEANTKSPVKAVLNDGTKFRIIEKQGDFYKVLITKNNKEKSTVYGYVLKQNTMEKGLTHTQIFIILLSSIAIIGLTLLILTAFANKRRF